MAPASAYAKIWQIFGKMDFDDVSQYAGKVLIAADLLMSDSEDPALDQKELPLVEALKQIVGRGMGTVLSCVPGRLAFVETEDERFILERYDPIEKREYICFVIGRKDEDSHVEQGISQAAVQALEWQNITGSDADELNELRAWFSENLEKPTSFGRDKLPRDLLVQDCVHRAHLPHLGDGPDPRTERHLREENQNRQTRLRDLRRRMATSSRILSQRHNAEKLKNPDPSAIAAEVDCYRVHDGHGECICPALICNDLSTRGNGFLLPSFPS
jgi:hypothetical protein